jgi:isopropylmalate/homocitrate/citramalate synthase
VHSTVSGLGERAGNTPMEELALALSMLYGVEQSLNTEEFYGLSRLVAERAGHRVPSNRPVVGEQLYEVESGIIAGWLQRCAKDYPTEVFPYHWDVVGQPAARVVYGKGSGIASVEVALQSLGVELDEPAQRQLLDAIKQRGLSLKSLLPLEEVAALVQMVTSASETSAEVTADATA